MIIVFGLCWVGLDIISIETRDISNELLDDYNNTYNETGDTRMLEFVDTGTEILDNTATFKQWFFYGGLAIILVSGIAMAYYLRNSERQY